MCLTLSWFALLGQVSVKEVNISEDTCRRYLGGVILNDHNAPVGRVVRDYNRLQERSVSLGRRREISRSTESAASFISTYPPLYLRLTVPEELRAVARETRTSATDKKNNERWSREHVEPERMCHKWRTCPANSTHNVHCGSQNDLPLIIERDAWEIAKEKKMISKYFPTHRYLIYLSFSIINTKLNRKKARVKNC